MLLTISQPKEYLVILSLFTLLIAAKCAPIKASKSKTVGLKIVALKNNIYVFNSIYLHSK